MRGQPGVNGKAQKKANTAVYVTLGLLLAAVAALAFLNRGHRELQRALEENREFEIRVNGERAATVSLQTLLDIGPQEFSASFATSIAAPRDTVLRGVELRALLDELGIDTQHANRLIVSGLDGYISPLTPEEVMQEGAVYICFSMDGEVLKTQSEGGYGPFLMVIRGERFAQRWCKYVEAVDVIEE